MQNRGRDSESHRVGRKNIEKLVELPDRITIYQMWGLTRKIIRKIRKKDK